MFPSLCFPPFVSLYGFLPWAQQAAAPPPARFSLPAWALEEGGSAAAARPGAAQAAPYVLFICQDEQQRQLFMHAADHELAGHRSYPADPGERHYLGRQRTLFATELDIHQGVLDAARLPPLPPGHHDRTHANSRVRRVRLPGPPQPHPDGRQTTAVLVKDSGLGGPAPASDGLREVLLTLSEREFETFARDLKLLRDRCAQSNTQAILAAVHERAASVNVAEAEHRSAA